MTATTVARDLAGKLYYNLLYRLETSPIEATVGPATARFDVRERESDYFHVRMLAHERPILEDCLAGLQPADTFWDVGAKIGLYSWLVADALDAGEVVAFEPTPGRAVRWRANHRVNPAATARLEPYALGTETATVEMSEGNIDPDAVAGAGAERFSADVKRGDDVIAYDGVPAPDVLKVDTEGYEYAVLAGLADTFAREPPRAVYVETHDKAERFGDGRDAAAVLNFMAERGYSRKRIESEYPHGNTQHWKFWRVD